MKHSRRNIYFHELIGLNVKIVEYPDQNLVGFEGRVLDETYKTLVLESPSGRLIRVLKEHGVFLFTAPHGSKYVVKGVRILGRPEDRLKKIVR